MAEKKTREACITLLRECAEKLREQNESRYPRRSDFAEEEVEAIKAFLGPWPRALEVAALKPPREDDRLEKNRQKRILAKRRRNAQRKENAEAKNV